MLKYILKRIGYMVVVLFIISTFLFWLYRQIPGDPARMLMGDTTGMSPEAVEDLYLQIRHIMGLDYPVFVQYVRWMFNMATGELGVSMHYRRPVLDVIRTPIFWTVVLNVTVMVIVFFITIPAGIMSAVKRGSVLDNSTLVVTVIGLSIPTFLIAMIFMVVFAVFLGWLPMTGMHTPLIPEGQWAQLVDRARHMVLPVMAIVVGGMGPMTRIVRAAMCDALTEDYVRTARAKGLTEKVVIYSHAFRNALIPLVTAITGWFMGIFGGSVVIESLFSWSGMGQVMLNSLMRTDYAVAMAMQVFYALVSLVAILLMDLIYGLVDPRIRVAS